MKWLWSLIILLMAVPGLSQSTAVSASTQDTDGQTWNNGTYSISFVPTPGKPGPYNWNGAPFVPQVYSGRMDGTGTLNVTLPSNNFIAPAGTSWKFVICPNATSGCLTTNISVSGATEDISSVVNALAFGPRFPATPGAYGYLDVEISPIPLPGGAYYNVTSLIMRCWNGSAWTNCGGGGGGSGTVQPAPQRQIAGYPVAGTNATVGPGSTVLNYVTPILQGEYQCGQFLSGGGNNGCINGLASSSSIATITNYSVSSNVATFTAPNDFAVGTPVLFAGMTGLTAINGYVGTVLSSGLSNTQFEVDFFAANASGAETGTASYGSGHVIADPTYLGTDINPAATSLNQHFTNYAGGFQRDYYYNPQFGIANTNWCATNHQTGVTGLGGMGCNLTNAYFLGMGTDAGNGFVFNTNQNSDETYNYLPGVMSYGVRKIHCMATGDCNTYQYYFFGADNRDPSGESIQPHAGHWDQFPPYVSSIASVADYRHIRTTAITGEEFTGGYVVSPSYETGTVTGLTGFGALIALITTTSHPSNVSQAWGQTTSQCFGTGGQPIPPNDTVNGQSCTITVNLLGGTKGQSATLTGSVSGTALTVSGVTGTIHVGDTLIGPSVPVAITIASGSGTSWVLSSTGGTIGSESMYTSTINGCNGTNCGFATGQEVCIAPGGQQSEEVTLTSVSADSGIQENITALLRYPMNTASYIFQGPCAGIQFVSDKQVDGSGNLLSLPTFALAANGPTATTYFGGDIDGSTPTTLPTSYTTLFANRDSSGHVQLELSTGAGLQLLQGFPNISLTGCSDSSLNFSAASVGQQLIQFNNPVGSAGYTFGVNLTQPGSGPFTPITGATGCLINGTGLSNYSISHIAEVQSVTDPNIAIQPNAEFAPLNGYMQLAQNDGWVTSATGQTIQQAGGFRLGINNHIEYTQWTPAAPDEKSYGQRMDFNGIGSTGPGQSPMSFFNNNLCGMYQGCSGGNGNWPILGFNLIDVEGLFGGIINVNQAPSFPGSFLINVGCPSNVSGFFCTQPWPYDVAILNGSGNAGVLSFTPNTLTLQYSQTFAAAILTANNGSANGNYNGLNIYTNFNNDAGPCLAFHTYGGTNGESGTDVTSKICGLDFSGGGHQTVIFANAGSAPVEAAIFGTFGMSLPPLAGGGIVQCIETAGDAFGTLQGTGSPCGSGGGGGVSSVAMTVPSWLTVTGSPITSSGTLAVTGTSESANLFLASPNGSSGAMTPRAIVSADVPILNQNTTGTAAALTGTPTTCVSANEFAQGISASGNAICNTHLTDNGTTLTYNGGGSVSSYQIGTNVFSALPACTSGVEGTQAPVTDSTTNTWGATITGSGTNHVLAYCDGTNWTVAAK